MADTQGWWCPPASRKYHYIGADSRALCGQWVYLKGHVAPEDGPSPDDCKACRRKLDATKAKEPTNG